MWPRLTRFVYGAFFAGLISSICSRAVHLQRIKYFTFKQHLERFKGVLLQYKSNNKHVVLVPQGGPSRSLRWRNGKDSPSNCCATFVSRHVLQLIPDLSLVNFPDAGLYARDMSAEHFECGSVMLRMDDFDHVRQGVLDHSVPVKQTLFDHDRQQSRNHHI